MRTAISEGIPELGFRGDLERLHEEWNEHKRDRAELLDRLQRKSLISHENLMIMSAGIDSHKEKEDEKFQKLTRTAIEELVCSQERERVLRDLEEILVYDYKVFMKEIERRLKEELAAKGVDVESFVAEHPEVVRDDFGTKLLNACAPVLKCARVELNLRRREFLVPRLAQKVSEARMSG